MGKFYETFFILQLFTNFTLNWSKVLCLSTRMLKLEQVNHFIIYQIAESKCSEENSKKLKIHFLQHPVGRKEKKQFLQYVHISILRIAHTISFFSVFYSFWTTLYNSKIFSQVQKVSTYITRYLPIFNFSNYSQLCPVK